MEKTRQDTSELQDEVRSKSDTSNSVDYEHSSSSRQPESAPEPTAEDGISSKLMAKLDLHIVPTLTVVYIMSFLDR